MNRLFAKMTGLPDNLTETPHTYATGERRTMDVLDEILGSLRLSGGVVVDGEFSGDFCVAAEFTPGHFQPFFPVPEKLMSYHYVRSGKLIVEVDGMAPVALEAGSIAILPRNDAHRLTSRIGLPPADVSEISRVTADGVHRVSSGTGGDKAEVWCGFLTTADASEHPLLDALPPLLTLKVVGGEAQWLDTSMRFLAEQQPSSEVVAKLAELFVTQAVREYVDRLPAGASGWLRGLTDPAVSKALAVIHARFAEEVDVESLARKAGVSRTVLGEKFVELLGEPPMRYCARWRMRVAANMLRDGKQTTANIAYSVGFNSEAAFNRAFKREYGVPPAAWRKREEAQRSGEEGQREPPARDSEDEIRTCVAADGARIAYACSGSGFPLVKAQNWITNIQTDRTNPSYRHWIAEGSRSNLFVRSDMRGFGMSETDPPAFDFESMVGDLAAIVDNGGFDRFDLLGVAHGAPIAIAYAARHPERVRKLVLVNSFACGWRVRADPEEIAWRNSLMELNRREWAFRRSLLGEMFLTLYFPTADGEIIDWHNTHFAEFGPTERLLQMIELAADIDVREELPMIGAPTLVCHARQDGNAPLTAGRAVADGIAGAKFVELDSPNHILLGNETAWPVVVREMRAFLTAD
jgi:pimeloyl-ACP methyl ester carboxylesterase/AraC-like DNA-binding protein